MRRAGAGILALLLAALLQLPAWAGGLPGPAEGYVSDFAGVLSDGAKAHIELNARALEEATGAQIAVVTLDTTKPLAIGDYAYRLFNSWKLGDARKNNGILVLLAVGDDDYYTLEGIGLERDLPPEDLSKLWNEHLEPDFAAKDYSSGAVRYFDALFERVADIYGIALTLSGSGLDQAAAARTARPTARPRADESRPGFDVELRGIILLLCLFCAIGFYQMGKDKADGGGDDDSGDWSSGGGSGSHSSGGGWSSGGGSSSSSRGSGGFSGGGGSSRGAGGGRNR